MNSKTKELCLTGLFMALVCVSTLFFKVPIPQGYAHLGNGFIFLAAVFLRNPYAMIASGFGSALADFLGGFGIWILPTLIIKCLMGFLVAAIARKDTPVNMRTFLAILAGTVEMVVGYTIAGAIIGGSLAAGLASTPGLIAEDIVGIVLFYVIGIALVKSGVAKYFHLEEE